MHDIHIFDFDYTLYKTSETVLVWSPRGDYSVNGKTCFRLLPSVFANYKFSNDEIINEESFLNFANIDFEKAKPIKPVLEIFNLVSNKLVLSARPQEAENDFHKIHNPEIKFIGLKNSSSKAKIDVIKTFTNPIVYEDSNSMIAALHAEKIDCVHVSSDSSCTVLKYYNF